MDVKVTARHVEVSEILKTYAAARVERLGRKHPSSEGQEAKFKRLRSESAPEESPVEFWW